jgi:hypothetical protein
MDALLAAAQDWEQRLDVALSHRGKSVAAGAPAAAPSNGTALPSATTTAAVDAAVLAFRKALSSVYSIVLMEDPVRAHGDNVEQRVWNLYYADISDAKTVLGKAKPTPSATAPPAASSAGVAGAGEVLHVDKCLLAMYCCTYLAAARRSCPGGS